MIKKELNPCVEWTGGKTAAGYGMISIGNRRVYVHWGNQAEYDPQSELPGMETVR